MNVTCDKCNKRYSIADDKVRGKSVKIRCKQCQNLISVQGPAAGAAPVVAAAAAGGGGLELGGGGGGGQALGGQWEDQPTRTMPSMDSSAQWFAMVKGTQLGPFDLRGLEGRVKTGELTLRTYLWRQGMGDWKRAADVPEVSPVFAGVSVGATATGPTAPAPPPLAKPASIRVPAVQRDVAVANESPSPEVTARKSGGNGNGNGHGAGGRTEPSPAHQAPPPGLPKPITQPKVAPVVREPVREPVPVPAVTPAAITAPVPTTTEPQMPKAEAPLSDLFSENDPKSPSIENMGSVPISMEQSIPAPEQDPFDALGPADPAMAPAIGEATKFFIQQSGANNRNPWWKILGVGIGAPALIVGVLFLLSTLGIAPLEVTRTNEKGEEVTESFFSSEGVGGLKDMLTGDAKRRKAQADAERARQAALAAIDAQKPKPKPKEVAAVEVPEQPEVVKQPTGALALIYGNEAPKVDHGPKVRLEDRPNQAATNDKGGLSPEVSQKVVADKIKAFEACIVEALHRNPNLAVGPIDVVLTVGASGVVTNAAILPAKWEASDWGGCMKVAAKRIVFPTSDRETEVSFPLKVGVSNL